MFLRLFPSRLKYQQIHIHRERFTVHQVCMIHAEELPRLRRTMYLLNATHGAQTAAQDSPQRLPDRRGVTAEKAESLLKGRQELENRQYFTFTFDLHEKSILVAASGI